MKKNEEKGFSPKEIMEALMICQNEDDGICRECPYYNGVIALGDCRSMMERDAASIIKSYIEEDDDENS